MDKFVQVWLQTRNATEAYAQSYSDKTSRKTATREGSRLLKHPKVAAAIEVALSAAAAKLEVTAKNTLKELARIAFLDPRRFFNDDNTLKTMLQLDDQAAAAISSLEIDELFEGTGKDRTWVGYTKKLKFWNKNDSLNTLAKYLKLVEGDDVDPDEAKKKIIGIPADMSTEEWMKKHGNPSGRLNS